MPAEQLSTADEICWFDVRDFRAFAPECAPQSSVGRRPEHATDVSLQESLAVLAERFPGKVAFTSRDQSLTYADLYERVIALAVRIGSDVPTGRALAILLPNGPTSVVGLLAALIAGRICLVLNADHPVERNSEILRSAHVHLVIIDATVGDAAIPVGCRTLTLEHVQPVDPEIGKLSPNPIRANDPAVVI